MTAAVRRRPRRRACRLSPAVRRPPAAPRGPGSSRSAPAPSGAATGSVNENVEPRPTSDSTHRRPPCCSTISRQMGSPRPVPRGVSVSVSPAWLNCSKTLAWSSGAMPMPVSATLTMSSERPSSAVSPAEHVMVPVGVNLTAFEMRLMTTWIRRSRSPVTGGRPSGTSTAIAGPESSRSEAVAAVARAMTSPTSTGSRRHSIRPASILARSSVSLMSAVSRSPSSMMIPRLSATWRIARSRFGSPVGTAGKTTSSSRRRMSLREAHDRGQRRAQLMADARQEGALRGRRLLGHDPGRLGLLDRDGKGCRALDDPPLEGVLLGFDLAVQPRVLDGGRDQAADGVQQRPVAGAHVATRRAVVDREHADGPALGHQGGPEERGDLHHPGEGPVALVGILVDMAEEERPVGLVELDQVRGRQVERQAQVGDRGGHLGAATDRPAVGQHVQLRVGQQDEGAIEAEMAGDGDERAVEQLVAIERRAGRGGQLVEGHQLGDPLLEVLVGELRALVGVLGQPLLRAQVLRPPAGRAAIQDEPGRQQRGEHDRHRLVGRPTRHEIGEHEARRDDGEQDDPTIHRWSRVRVSP